MHGLSSPELYRTALTAAGAAISGARSIAASSPDTIGSTDAVLTASCATLSPNTADPCLVARLAAEARERSLSLTDPETQARGAKRAAGSSAQDEAAGRGPAL